MKTLLAFILALALSGCYTQIVTRDSEPSDTSVTAPIPISYGWEYYGYQPYWYNGYYTPWYSPYRAYVIPFRPYKKPIWRVPFHYVPPKSKPTPPRKEIINYPSQPRRESGAIRYAPQRMPEHSTPPQRGYSPPQVANPPAPAPAGNRSSGATRSDRQK